MVELGNTQNKSVSREWIVVDSIRVCKICVCSNSNVMSSKEVLDTSLESISKSHTTTYNGTLSVHSFLRFVCAPITRASYESSRACRSANLALK